MPNPAVTGAIPQPQHQPQPSVAPGPAARRPALDAHALPRIAEALDFPHLSSAAPQSGLPPAASDYTVADEGNATARSLRMASGVLPSSAEVEAKVGLVMGGVVQPLARPLFGEAPVPVIDVSTCEALGITAPAAGRPPLGPLRCASCRAYANPHFRFLDLGDAFECNLCLATQPTPQHFRCMLDSDGLRRDRLERLEFSRGTVEYIVPSDFAVKPVQDPHVLYLVDVSAAAVASGLTADTIAALRAALPALAEAQPSARVAVLAHDDVVTLFAPNRDRAEPDVTVMCDLDDPFLPLPTAALFTPLAPTPHRPSGLAPLLAILDLLATVHAPDRLDPALVPYQGRVRQQSALGAALKTAQLALAGSGGKAVCFASSLCSVGVGKLRLREAKDDPSRAAMYAIEESFYQLLGAECAEVGVSVDLFACSAQYLDLVSVAPVVTTSAGQLYRYHAYDSAADRATLAADVLRGASRRWAAHATMVVRTSVGLEVAELLGNTFCRRPLEATLAGIDEDKAFGFILKHSGGAALPVTLTQDSNNAAVPAPAPAATSSGGLRGLLGSSAPARVPPAAVQVAVVFTDQRSCRIRVHTLALPVASDPALVIRAADADAVACMMMKQAAAALHGADTEPARAALTGAAVSLLALYRKHSARSSSLTQLILPEPLKTLPVLALGAIKHPLLHADTAPDARAALRAMLMAAPASLFPALLVPRLADMARLPADAAVFIDQTQTRMMLPPRLPPAAASLPADAAVLLDDATDIYLYLGPAAPAFARAALQAVLREDAEDALPEEASLLRDRVRALVTKLRQRSPWQQRLRLVEAQQPHSQSGATLRGANEIRMSARLVDDPDASRAGRFKMAKAPAPHCMSYMDFLVWMHKQIAKRLM
jgi:protein transport protein SEC24